MTDKDVGEFAPSSTVLAMEPDSSARLFPSNVTAADILREYPDCYVALSPHSSPDDALPSNALLPRGTICFVVESLQRASPHNVVSSQSDRFDLQGTLSGGSNRFSPSRGGHLDSSLLDTSHTGSAQLSSTAISSCVWAAAYSPLSLSPSPSVQSFASFARDQSPATSLNGSTENPQEWPPAPPHHPPSKPPISGSHAVKRSSWPGERLNVFPSTWGTVPEPERGSFFDMDCSDDCTKREENLHACAAAQGATASISKPPCGSSSSPAVNTGMRRSSSSSLLSSFAKLPAKIRSLGSRRASSSSPDILATLPGTSSHASNLCGSGRSSSSVRRRFSMTAATANSCRGQYSSHQHHDDDHCRFHTSRRMSMQERKSASPCAWRQTMQAGHLSHHCDHDQHRLHQHHHHHYHPHHHPHHHPHELQRWDSAATAATHSHLSEWVPSREAALFCNLSATTAAAATGAAAAVVQDMRGIVFEAVYERRSSIWDWSRMGAAEGPRPEQSAHLHQALHGQGTCLATHDVYAMTQRLSLECNTTAATTGDQAKSQNQAGHIDPFSGFTNTAVPRAMMDLDGEVCRQ